MSRQNGDEPVDEEQTTKEDSGVPTTKQRRATARRKLERQLERRAKQSRRRRILTIAGVVAVVAVVAGLGVWKFVFDKGSKATTTASSTTSAAPTPPPVPPGGLPAFSAPPDLGANCQYPATPNEPAAKEVDPPRTGKVPTDPAVISMSITTNQGPLGVHLNNGQAPCTVNNFVSLAQKGYYNDTRCHRLSNNQEQNLYVLQCGDPKGDGTGGPGYQFANEYPTNQYRPDDPALNQAVLFPRGTLAMANSGQPGTNGSQFFVVYKDSTLPPAYTVFGTVDQNNLATLDKIAAAGTADGSPDGKPKLDVIITSARAD